MKGEERKKEVEQYCTSSAPGLGHLIVVGEFGCQGNRATGTAEVLKYIFYEIV